MKTQKQTAPSIDPPKNDPFKKDIENDPTQKQPEVIDPNTPKIEPVVPTKIEPPKEEPSHFI